MLRIGAEADHAREMDLDDILRGRIDLLILMAKEFLQGSLTETRRLQVLEKNARHVEMECTSLLEIITIEPMITHPYFTIDFCQCLKRLADMMRAVARGEKATDEERQAIADYADAIADAMDEDDQATSVLIEDCLNVLLMRLMVVF